MTQSMVSVIVLLTVLALAACGAQSRRVRDIAVPDVDLSQVDHGVCRGEVMYRDNRYRLEVRVRDQRISGLEVLHSEGEEHDLEALVVLERVVAEQSVAVDAVSGATRSSKLYLMAAYHALTGQKIHY